MEKNKIDVERLFNLAYFDKETGLGNRNWLEFRTKSSIFKDFKYVEAMSVFEYKKRLKNKDFEGFEDVLFRWNDEYVIMLDYKDGSNKSLKTRVDSWNKVVKEAIKLYGRNNDKS